MAGSQLLTQQKIWMEGHQIQSDVSAFNFDYSAEIQDGTTFGDTTRIRKGCLKVLDFALEGFWKGGSSNIDDFLFSRVGLANSEVTISSTGSPTAGSIVYMARGVVGAYTPLSGAVGEMARFTLDGMSDDRFVRGTLLHDSTGITATGNGSWHKVGATAATQRLYGVLHVVSAAGSTNTLDVVVQSDSSTGAATPTTKLTFAQQTDNASDWQSLGGANTDTFFRVSHTVAGATADFEYAVAVGVLTI